MAKKRNREFSTDQTQRKLVIIKRHDLGIATLERELNNLEMELATKKKRSKEILNDQNYPASTVHAMGKKILKLRMDIRCLKKSIRLLTKNNKPLKD